MPGPNDLGVGAGAYADPYTKQLLDLAQQQGGAVAQTAGELVHPNGGFLSMAKDKLGQAFHGMMDVLATPEETIAAGMSMFTGNPVSLHDAYTKHIQPSQILFGAGEAESKLGKAGMFGIKFLTDTLLDPLTYATFGEYHGLMGLSKLSQIPLGPETAKELGFDTLAQTTKGAETIRHHALSEEGQEIRQKLTTRAEDTIKNDTLERAGFGAKGASRGAGIELSTALPGTAERFISADNIRGRITKTLGSLIGKTLPEMLAATIPAGAEVMAAKSLMDIVKEAGLVSKPVEEMAPEELDQWRHAINTSTKQAMDDQAARLVRHTLQSRRSDIDMAVGQQMKRLLERDAVNGHQVTDKFGKPVTDQFGNKMVRNLAQAYLDKGGFKFAGASVVSGVRIRQMMSMVKPAEDYVGTFGPKAAKTLAAVSEARNKFASLFSTNWKSSGRIPDTMLQITRAAKFKQEAQLNEFINTTHRMAQRLKIGGPELDLAMSAAMLDKAPAESADERLPALYAMIHSENGNKVMKDIASGVYGQGVNPEEVQKMWAAAKFVKRQLQQNLVMTRDSGMAIFEQKNYLPLLFNEPKQIRSPFLQTKSAQAANAAKGQINKWSNVEDPTKVLFGTQEHARDAEGNVHFLKQYNKVEERNRVQQQLNSELMSNTGKVQDIKSEMEDIWGKVNERFKKSMVYPNEAALREAAGGDKYNFKALMEGFEKSVPDVDRARLMEQYSAKAAEATEGIVKGNRLKVEDIRKLKEELKTGDQDIDNMVDRVLSGAKEFTVSTGKKVAGAAAEEPSDYDKALKELQKTIKENGMDLKQRMVTEALSKDDSFKEAIANMSDEWHQNPEGVQGFLKQIAGRGEEVEKLMSDISQTKTSLEHEMNQPGLSKVGDRWFYKDNAGEVYKRERATAQEINDNLFDGEKMFETSSFKSLFAATENTLRTVNTKNLLGDIAKMFGVPESEAPSNYLKVSIAGMSEKAGDLPDMLVKSGANKEAEALMYHPAVAEAIVDMMRVMDKDPASSLLLGSFDHMTNIFKTSVTSIWPAFFGRNAISNVWQSMMDIGHEALSPANHMMTVQLQSFSRQLETLMTDLAESPSAENMKKYFDISDKVILKDARGYEWTVGELDRVIRDNVVAFHPSILGMMDSGLTSTERMEELEDELFAHTDKWGNAKRSMNPFKQSFAPFKVGRNLANYTESEPRILNFLANLRRTGDVSFAAHQTKQFLYDHSNLTPFERNFMRRVVPFYSYTRKNLEGMTQTLIHKPGRIDWFRNTYMNVGDVMAGGNLSSQERAQLPPWMRDGVDAVVERNGKNVSLLTSMGSPFEAPFDELGNLFGSLNPLFKGPIEQATGYSFFEGKPLSQVTDATAFKSAPQSVKDLIGFTTKVYRDSAGQEHVMYISLNPKMMNMFQNMPFTSRTLSSLALLQNPNIDAQNKVLANLTGIKPTVINLEDEQFQRQKELDAQIQQILSNAGVGYQRTEYTAPTGTHLMHPPRNPENQ